MSAIEKWGKLLGITIAVIYLVFLAENEAYQWTWFILILTTIGIPHGAIDHLLDRQQVKNRSLIHFLFIYITIILFYLLIWWLIPVYALLAFLLISAYHFGQSHFIQYPPKGFKALTYLTLGSYYLSVILGGDFESTAEILSSLLHIGPLGPYKWMIIGSLFLGSAILIYSTVKQKGFRMLLAEMIVMGIVLYFTPLLLAFIIYFGFWHALPSMYLEYQILKEGFQGQKLKKFIYQLLPFSLLSLVGMALIIILFFNRLEQEQLVLLFFVLVSLISAPHIWFMNRFIEDRE